MTTAVETRPRPAAPTATGRIRAGHLADAAVLLCFAVAAFALYRSLWLDLERGYLIHGGQDQNMWEWFFAVTAHSVANGESPLFTTLQNYPLGVNLMANTVMLGIGIPLTPVTLLFGPTMTWTVTLTGGLAGTAAAWYWVLSRHIVTTRIGAAIGAAFCGFAPPIISHANAHPNFVVLFVLPFIVLRLLRLVQGNHPVRDGVVLGLLVAYQIFLGEEVLLIMATTLVVFAAVYALSEPEQALGMAKPLAQGLAVGAGVSLVVVAIPLWWQFFGAQSYPGLEHGLRGNDVAAFTAFPTRSLAADPQVARELSMNRTEENAFFGWPLVLLLLGVSVALWRHAVARALAVAMLVLAWVSMGAVLVIDGTATSIPGPWMALFDLPLYDSVLESRFALGCVPVAGVLLALATERVLRLAAAPEWRHAARIVWLAAVVCAFAPIVPTEFPVSERNEAPAFLADGLWRDYVDPGGSVVMVPLPSTGHADPLHWQVEAGLEYPLAEGYFVGPGDDGEGIYGAVRRPTSRLLEEVADKGTVPDITADQRADAVADLRYWHADVLVLPVSMPHHEALRETVDGMLDRPGQLVGGAWVWDVREG